MQDVCSFIGTGVRMDISEYCDKELIIDGLKTYIISPRYYEEFLRDVELLQNLGIRECFYDFIRCMMGNTFAIREIKIGFAIVLHENRKICRWEPVNVYEDAYHVFIRTSWMCIDCRHFHEGIIMMPMAESDACFLDKKMWNNYSIPSICKKIKCEKCGRELLNHLYYNPKYKMSP